MIPHLSSCLDVPGGCTPSTCPNDGRCCRRFLSKYQLRRPSAIASLAVGSSVDAPPLPRNYRPGQLDVICGRGKASYYRPGNVRFRQIVGEHVDEYKAATSKLDKTSVLTNILDRVRSATGSTDVGNRVRIISQKEGTWCEISDDQAREKVGHSMREAILAQESAPEREERQHEFQMKQSDLLESQRKIFEDLVGPTRTKKRRRSSHQQPDPKRPRSNAASAA